MDDDENLSTLLAMGFPDINEIKRALRLAKNDLNEAVAILTNEQPLSSYGTVDDLSLDIDMKDQGSNENTAGDDSMEFPVTNLYELESRVFSENWSIPYKREESLGKCLVAATRLAKEGLMEADENCKKFIEKVMPEAFRKLLTSNATHRWHSEIQEGIFNMLELYIDLVCVRLARPPVPNGLLSVLALAFDIKNDWNSKNEDQQSKGRWQNVNEGPAPKDFAKPQTSGAFGRTEYSFGWLCDLINQFGDKEGFDMIGKCFEDKDMTARTMAALLLPLSNCAELLVSDVVQPTLSTCMEKAFQYVEGINETDLKSKEIMAVSDLLAALKMLCHQFWPQYVNECDKLRLNMIYRMLKTPMFNTKMNALKEVSRLIEECDQINKKRKTAIGVEQIVEWMAEKKVLTVALEGNIDQVQYTDRIKAIVEFLGPRLSIEELTKIWNLQDSPNSHVMDNVHSIMSGAAAKFSLAQFEHLTELIEARWKVSNDRIREKLLVLIGQIGKEAKQMKSTQRILQLLWDVSHLHDLPKHLVERAMQEQLAILNELTVNKDPMRRNYVLKCVDDIKSNNECLLPAVKQLHAICKSYSKGTTSIYHKADKATLGELNKQHEIVKLLSMSLRHSHKLAISASKGALTPETIVDGRYPHSEFVDSHLDLMTFFLKEGDLYLSWARCREVWETLVDNPDAIEYDRESCFAWFQLCLVDLEVDTQRDMFKQKLLKISPSQVSHKCFHCLRTFFENINLVDGNLKKNPNPSLLVERLDLFGLEFFWDLITDSPRDKIADLAIEYLLNMSYLHVSPRLKKDSASLHKKFLDSCYEKMEDVFTIPAEALEKVEEGCEIETCVPAPSANEDDPKALKVLTAISVSKVLALPPQPKGEKLQKIRRLLLLAERYVSMIEETFAGKRTFPPHAVCFFGRPIKICVRPENKKDEFTLDSHTNELVGDVKRRLCQELRLPVEQVDFHCGDISLSASKDSSMISSVGSIDGQIWFVKKKSVSTTASSSAVVVYQDSAGGASAGDSGRQAYQAEQEKSLPGVVMATGGRVFRMLYQIASLGDSKIMQGVKRLLHLIPTDQFVSDTLDAISFHSSASPMASADASPKLSPRNKKMFSSTSLEDAKRQLAKLLDANAVGMSPFRVLYNLEVISGRLMPTMVESRMVSQQFSQDFLNSGGLRLILNVLQKDSLPVDIDYDIRQTAYIIALQIAGFLLCGQTVLHSDLMLTNPITSPIIKPTPPKKSALDSSVSMGAKSPITVSASKIVQTMSESEFSQTVSCFMRVIWAAAAGRLQLASSGIQSTPNAEPHRFFIGHRTSARSSTESSGSTGSDSESNGQLHAGVCAQQTEINPADCHIAGEAFELMVTCLQLRNNNIAVFYNHPSVKDFIIDLVLFSPSEDVRRRACEQLIRMSKIRLSARALNLDVDGSDAKTLLLTPKQFLTKTLIKAPVPLWMPSCKARGITHTLLGQCTQYFDLRCELLRGLSLNEQKHLGESAVRMIEDELTFLQNFASCPREEDCSLLAGHLRCVEALLTCEGVNKIDIAKELIDQLLDKYLFPASKLIVDGGLNNNPSEVSGLLNPKCDTSESRIAAYNLLVELSRGCLPNMEKIATELIRLHHRHDDSLTGEYEYEPSVERRAACNFVGLKNAGATCYMNSVLQQLYCVPGIREQILSVDIDSLEEESVFYQLQSVFGHLLESKLQACVPEKFWKCFKLRDRPVNVREQQDAFEFFTEVVDQVDEFLEKNSKSKLFSSKFECLFSDQIICEGCPHLYEREQSGVALNLTVSTNQLQESLDQFVKGELLEGDNAYFCENCKEKRKSTKRMCIKSLPSTLVIQLKRFEYDWETNRALKVDDHFQFPWTLEMGPYTVEGIQRREASNDGGRRKDSKSGMHVNVDKVSYPYDLVGVVVHSGQASAGHYYSFIKDRRGNSLTNPNKNKWFKFNDTTVEEFDMNDETLAAECFGGSYKVKKTPGSNSSLPENRQRYWNAYMLFYESQIDLTKTPRTPKKSLSQSQKFGGGSSSRRISRISEPSPAPRESLSELSDLLQKGEQKGLFTNRTPAAIERMIQEENLKFLQNRDIYSDDYFQFIYELLSCNLPTRTRCDSKLCTLSVNLAVHFLLNSYFHVRKRQRTVMSDVVDAVETIITHSNDAAEWLVRWFAADGLQYLRPILLECNARDVRANFSHLVQLGFSYYVRHGGNSEVEFVRRILSTLVGFLEKDVAVNVKTSGQYFWLISKFAQMGVRQCQQLFHLNTFRFLIKFLLGVEPDPDESDLQNTKQRRWTTTQCREFGELHSAMAYLILACDMKPLRTCADESSSFDSRIFPSADLCPMPATVSTVMFGSLGPVFVREVVSACREISGSISIIVEMLLQAAYCNRTFTKMLLEEVMRQYSNVNSGEIKNLSTLLVDLLTLNDPLQQDRLKFAIEGDTELSIDGLLVLVKNNESSDSCRAYQCIKTLVSVANKSAKVKEYLLQDAGRLQWSVDWLKSKMDEHTYWSSSSDSVLSNEDSTTRTFHRTTSAQVTLDEAKALLAEFVPLDMETDDDNELPGLQEVQSDPADLDAIDP